MRAARPAQCAHLAALPPEVVTAFSMYADGEILEAEQLIRHYLLTHGDHVEAMRLLAQDRHGSRRRGRCRSAARKRAAARAGSPRGALRICLVLLKRHKHVRAREQMEMLLKIDPDNRAYRTTYATVCTGLADYDRALPLYREVLAETPQ